MANKKNDPNHLGFGRLMAWKSSDIAMAGLNVIVLGYLTIYCSDTLGIAPAVVGTVLMVSKIIDAFTDIFAGWLVDNTHTKLGKGRPYELAMKYETYFKLVLATGLRRGEACGLKWSDINWRKRTIHVQRGVVKLSHQESITKDPKTSSGDRMVYLSKEMCQLLKAWRKECEWDRAQTANETVDDNDYLFRQPNGKPMNPCTFTYRFKLILKANSLPLDLNVHSLRHTNASLLIAQGVDVRTVASLLGHAQASTTLDIYAHAFDKNKRKAQEKLGKAIGL